MTNFEPESKVYTGRLLDRDDAGWTNLPGMRDLVLRTWPDVVLPTDIILIPREDFEVLLYDARGRIKTPSRAPVGLRVEKAPAQDSGGNHKAWFYLFILCAAWFMAGIAVAAAFWV